MNTYLASAELRVKVSKGGVGLCENHKARSVHAKAVAGHLVGVAGFAAKGIEYGLLEGGVAILAGGGEDAGGLVDDDYLIVVVNYLQVLIFWLCWCVGMGERREVSEGCVMRETRSCRNERITRSTKKAGAPADLIAPTVKEEGLTNIPII